MCSVFSHVPVQESQWTPNLVVYLNLWRVKKSSCGYILKYFVFKNILK